jgi:Ca2+-binding RTX toxin-like protein
MTTFTGTTGNDVFKGGNGEDLFDLGQGGNDKATGGGGDDIFDFGGAFTSRDVVVGGKGDDVLRLNGDYSAGLTFGAKSIKQVEGISFGAHFNYHLTSVDGNVAAGQSMSIDGSELTSADRLFFDGSAESDGAFVFGVRFARANLIGGAGDDLFHLGDRFSSGLHASGGGGDKLTGGGGSDTFVFLSLGKAGARPHEITDLTNDDRIDISNLDADSQSAGDQAFVLVSSFTHQAGEAMLAFDVETGKTSLLLDTNGDAKADHAVLIDGDHHDFSNFVL